MRIYGEMIITMQLTHPSEIVLTEDSQVGFIYSKAKKKKTKPDLTLAKSLKIIL